MQFSDGKKEEKKMDQKIVYFAVNFILSKIQVIQHHTTRFLVGSNIRQVVGLENTPEERRLAVVTVRNAAAMAVAANVAVAMVETIAERIGTESVMDAKYKWLYYQEKGPLHYMV